MTSNGYEDLRTRYVAVICYVDTANRANAELGAGSRVLFIAACDGRELVAYDTVGRRYTGLNLAGLTLTAVLDESGKSCRYEFDKQTGHLLVFTGMAAAAEGEEPAEEWLDCFPWKKYAPEASKAVRDAIREGSADSGDGGLDLLAPERVF